MEESSHNPEPPAESESLPPGASSVEDKCPICLDDFKDKAFVTVCFHAFCFECIVRAASTMANKCPLCKSRFYKVIHNVRANDDYSVHLVSRFDRPETEGPENSLHALMSDGLLERSVAAGMFAAMFGGLRSGRRRRAAASVQRRRAVYSVGLLARLPPPSSGRRRRVVRDISASFFRANPACTHRLVPWLNREVEALLGAEQVSFIVRLILSIVDRVDLESGELFGSHLYDFLGDRTSHFMHELVTFARSPLDMIAYDQAVVYDWPAGHPEQQQGGGALSSMQAVGESSSMGVEPSGEGVAATSWQRVIQLVTEEDEATDGPSHIPVVFTDSPIIIHGSSSEEEEESALVYRDSAYPSLLRTSQSKPSPSPPRRRPTDTPLDMSSEGMARTTREPDASATAEANQPGSTSTITAGTMAPDRMDSSSGDVSDYIDDDLVQLFVAEDDEVDLPLVASPGSSSKLGKRSPGKQEVSIGGKEKEHKSQQNTKRSKTEKMQEKSRREYGFSRMTSKKGRGRESSERSLKSRHHSSQKHERESKKSARRSTDYEEKERGSHPRRDPSSHSPNGKQPSRDDGRRSKRDRGKGKLGSSDHDYRKNKHGKSIKYASSSSPIVISSDSEYDGGDYLHRHYHHHQHHHHHHHKNKKTKHHRISTGHSHRLGKTDRKIPETEVCPTSTKEELLQESRDIEEEITNNKKEILKSSLRKERIELLHRTVHGNALSENGSTGSGGSEDGRQLSKPELESQLTELERDLVKEKQELLKVICRLERQEQSDSD